MKIKKVIQDYRQNYHLSWICLAHIVCGNIGKVLIEKSGICNIS